MKGKQKATPLIPFISRCLDGLIPRPHKEDIMYKKFIHHVSFYVSSGAIGKKWKMR